MGGGRIEGRVKSSEGEVAKLRAELREVKAKADRAVIEARNVERYHVEKIGDLEKTVERHKEGEIEAARRKVGVDSGVQSEGVEVAATGTQTVRRTYASVVAQAEDTGEKMDVDGPSGGDGGQLAGPTTEKPAGTTPVGDRPVRAFVVHGVACSGPWAYRSREMEKAFGRKGGGVIWMRWLLQWSRRRDRSFTSMVVYLRRVIPTAEAMYVRVWGRRHRVEEYQWDRQPRQLE